ncbi:MAG TPA: hypothetical protein VNH64_05015 [Parvularculaceae bacterium]|nr:hypothetical protein [Parvularculaceae bacterium]
MNYANLIAPHAPAKALEAYERALAITRKGMGELDPAELELRVAETGLTVDIENHERALALESLLANQPTAPGRISEALALGWFVLAQYNANKHKYSAAKSDADKAVEAASKLDPPYPSLLAQSLLLAGGVRITRPDRAEKDIIEAIALFDAAFPLFPPQADIDRFDPLLARLISWRQSVAALANAYGSTWKTKTGSRLPTGEDLKSAFETAQARSTVESEVRWENPHPEYCDADDNWKSRELPNYPASAVNAGLIGGIVIGYDLNDTGVERTIVLADLEKAKFGKNAVEAMANWRLAKPLPEECRKNHLAIFSFTIE